MQLLGWPKILFGFPTVMKNLNEIFWPTHIWKFNEMPFVSNKAVFSLDTAFCWINILHIYYLIWSLQPPGKFGRVRINVHFLT